MFFKANFKLEEGIVYIIKMVLDDGTVIYKIGVTKRKIEDRLAEIVIDIFKKLRYIPRTSLKRFQKSTAYEHIEAELLELYSIYKYKWDITFGGCTEFIYDVDEEELLAEYDKRIK